MALWSLNLSNHMRAPIRIVIFLTWSAAVAVASVQAQPDDRPGFKSSAQPSPVESVARLLQSNDPREQAWGAWYAGRDVMPQLVPLLERTGNRSQTDVLRQVRVPGRKRAVGGLVDGRRPFERGSV